MTNKNILLIEPGYKNKYPPLGLMKIAAYHGPFGKRDNITFVKGEENRAVLNKNWDRIYVTTLFSFEWREISKSIDFAVQAAQGNTSKIFVGGIAASLMQSQFLAEKRWMGIRFIKGLLSEAPAVSLQLDDFAGELYSSDTDSTPIEDLVPDYGILEQIDYRYPVHDAYFTYASRGCVRKCHFCGVPKLEGAQRDAQPISQVVRGVEERYGPKKDLLLMDNNVVASVNYKNIIAEIRDLGFERGAKLQRPGMRLQVARRVDFNQGVDARILCKDKMYLQEMATIAIKPLRIAFDHIGARKPYETAIRFAYEVGLHDLSNYMLYNFHDSPEDLYERMRMNINLNEELGIRIFSFPMRYQPTDMKDRSHIGDKWSKYQLRSMQIILQATHGIVSGSPEYFKRAFGETTDKFHELLLWPQHILFNRAWYEQYEGRGEFDEFQHYFNKLSASDKDELKGMLSVTPSEFESLAGKAGSAAVNSVLPFYVSPIKVELRKIWDAMRAKQAMLSEETTIPEDELVEDAGLAEAI